MICWLKSVAKIVLGDILQTSRNWIIILTSTIIIYLINIHVREVLTLFDVISQRLVHGFWALILLGNQISNWNHVTGRTDPQPAEPISRYSVFLFRLFSLLCLFIYLSIYPYLLSPTLPDHHRPSERTVDGVDPLAHVHRLRRHPCDATFAAVGASSTHTKTQLHPHRSTSGFSRLINDLGDLVRLGTFSFALKRSTLLLFHRAWVLPERNSNVVPFSQFFTECPWKWRNLHVALPRRRAHVELPIVSESVSRPRGRGVASDTRKNGGVPSMSIWTTFARDRSRPCEFSLHQPSPTYPFFPIICSAIFKRDWSPHNWKSLFIRSPVVSPLAVLAIHQFALKSTLHDLLWFY